MLGHMVSKQLLTHCIAFWDWSFLNGKEARVKSECVKTIWAVPVMRHLRLKNQSTTHGSSQILVCVLNSQQEN